MNIQQLQLKTAERFAETNLKQCCVELLDWHNSTILVDGKVRELTTMLIDLGGDLTLAEHIVTDLAIRFASKHG